MHGATRTWGRWILIVLMILWICTASSVLLWSKELIFWSLALLNLGCLLRVSMEPLSYELDWRIAWKLLPVSAVIELTAVTLFAINLVGTLVQKPAYLRQLSDPISNQ